MEQQVQQLAEVIQQLQVQQQELMQENQRLREGQAGVQALATSVAELAQSMKKEHKDRKILVDTKGLGKPDPFDNKEEHFRRWIRSINNLVTGIFGTEFEKVLEECLDSEDPVTILELEATRMDPLRTWKTRVTNCSGYFATCVPGKVKIWLWVQAMVLKPIGGCVGDGTPPRAGVREIS